jgi:hypothetical protein
MRAMVLCPWASTVRGSHRRGDTDPQYSRPSKSAKYVPLDAAALHLAR